METLKDIMPTVCATILVISLSEIMEQYLYYIDRGYSRTNLYLYMEIAVMSLIYTNILSTVFKKPPAVVRMFGMILLMTIISSITLLVINHLSITRHMNIRGVGIMDLDINTGEWTYSPTKGRK